VPTLFSSVGLTELDTLVSQLLITNKGEGITRKSAEERKEEIVRTSLALMAEVEPDRLTTGMIAVLIGLT